MKKVLLLIIILLTTGCYDYTELNNLAIVSSIGIDFQDNNYILTLEILNDTDAIDITVTGNTITEAFDNASLTINKIPYYYHLKALIISETIQEDKLSLLLDYFLRNPKIIHGFYLVMCKDISAKDFLNKKHFVIGEEIVNKIENNPYLYNISYNGLFEDVLEQFINKRKDALLTTFIIKDDQIQTYGVALFKDTKLVTILNNEESAYLNLLLNNQTNLSLDNDDLTINIYDSKTMITFPKNITIQIDCEAQITNNKKHNDLKHDESYLKFNNDFSVILKDKVTSLLEKLNKLEVDPIGFKWQYYKQTKKDLTISKFNLNINLKVNKKGLVFEANYE